MDWQNAQIVEAKGLKIPDRWLHLYYYEALNILFRFENALRIFVYVILKKELGKQWDQAAIGDGITIRTETKKRIAQAREHGYLGYEVTSPVLYLNSGELVQIITSETYWRHFAPYFKAAKAVVLTKFQEIGTVRNSLAHFRPVKQDDVDLVKQNTKHLMLEIEQCLVNIFSITDVVPTNSNELWYSALKAIGSSNLTTALYLSGDQKWVRLELRHNMVTLKKEFWGERYCSFNSASFRTLMILEQYPDIRDNCIYVSEAPIYGRFETDWNISATKVVGIVFARDTLGGAYQSIADAVRSITLKVDSETTLLVEDNLAKGELIEPKRGTATLPERPEGEKYWSFDMTNFSSSASQSEVVEFWGQRSNYVDDFVAATSRYPWMPSTVSASQWYD